MAELHQQENTPQKATTLIVADPTAKIELHKGSGFLPFEVHVNGYVIPLDTAKALRIYTDIQDSEGCLVNRENNRSFMDKVINALNGLQVSTTAYTS